MRPIKSWGLASIVMGWNGSGGNRSGKHKRRLVQSCAWLDVREIWTEATKTLLRDAKVEMTTTHGNELHRSENLHD